jgi:hypothetical protein
VSWRLASEHEPFRWALSPALTAVFVEELGWKVTGHADATVLSDLAGSTGENPVIARGEEGNRGRHDRPGKTRIVTGSE